MISKHLERDYRLAKGCFRVQGKPRAPHDHDAGSSRKVGARSRRETSRGDRPIHVTDLYWPLSNFAFLNQKANQNTENASTTRFVRLAECTIGGRVTIVTRSGGKRGE
ncbi:unnamed protein product [Lasius platythorax]|uniref:Uncharacterized protein n=1 Tax=Lasius platythorax TaxID=488582 RepID=A0AAV2NB93_9HYME